MVNFLSRVTMRSTFIIESSLRPLEIDFGNLMSKRINLLDLPEVINATIKSSILGLLYKITAGRTFWLDRSVKGKEIKTISPLTMFYRLAIRRTIYVWFVFQEIK